MASSFSSQILVVIVTGLVYVTALVVRDELWELFITRIKCTSSTRVFRCPIYYLIEPKFPFFCLSIRHFLFTTPVSRAVPYVKPDTPISYSHLVDIQALAGFILIPAQ